MVKSSWGLSISAADFTTQKLSVRPAGVESVDDVLALCFGGVDCFSEGCCLVTGENEDDVSGEYHAVGSGSGIQ